MLEAAILNIECDRVSRKNCISLIGEYERLDIDVNEYVYEQIIKPLIQHYK
jgi:hypothetical protein